MTMPQDNHLDLAGSVVVVTGGGSGIGAAMARRFAAEGSRVAVLDLHADAAVEVARDIDGAAFGVDVTDGDAVTAVVRSIEDELGPIEVYCSNAGIGGGRGLGSDEEWAASWAVHGMAHVRAIRAVIPAMVARGRGHFVVTA